MRLTFSTNIHWHVCCKYDEDKSVVLGMNVYGHVDRRGERVTQLGVREGCSWVKVH